MSKSTRSACLRMEDNAYAQRPSSPEEAAAVMHDRLAALSRRNGMEFFMVTWFPRGDRPELDANLVTANWPKQLSDDYGARGGYGDSRLIRKLKESIVPYYGDEPVFTGEGGAQQADMARLFRQSGLCHHLAFALHDAQLNHYVFAFSARNSGLSDERIAALYFGSLELLDSCGGSLRHREGPREKLSSRELECLRWSAAGKSSEEIAIILDISSHTVVSYLKSAMRKLDSVNRMQAIARAYRFRLL